MNLPLILAGPILRRAESHRVCIWIAASKPIRIRAEILQTESISAALPDLVGIQPDSIGMGEAESTALGKNLHIALVQVYPSGSVESLKTGAKRFSNQQASGLRY